MESLARQYRTGPGAANVAGLMMLCTIFLPTARQALASGVTITANAPTYNFQVLPGSTRSINVQIAGGTQNTVNWTVKSSAGGATATFTTPAGSAVTSVTGGLGVVQVNIGPTAGNCSITGGIGTYAVVSTATLIVQAQSTDDLTRTVTFRFNVCAKTTTVKVAPAYQQAYKGQHRMLQSWVVGDTDETGTWSITAQPAGGDGHLADTGNRDADFWATITGRYTLKYTSHSNATKSATAIVYVSPHAMPAYSSTPNLTEPRECYMDPAFTGNDYEVGAGKTYATLQSTPPYYTLKPGSIIRVWNTDTTGAAPSVYPEFYQIGANGTPTQPIILCGVPDKYGNLPILDGDNSTGQPETSTGAAAGYGLVSTWGGGFPGSSHYGYWQDGSSAPSYVTVSGLHLRHARPGYSYKDPMTGATVQWGAFTSCINARSGIYLDFSGNDLDTCGQAVYTQDNGNNAWATLTQLVTVTGNHIHGSGISGDDHEHQLYVEALWAVVQGNTIDQYTANAYGSDLKWRGVEGIFRYNYIGGGTARNVDMVDNEDGPEYVTFEDYLGHPGETNCDASLYCLGDKAGANIIAAYQESAQKEFLYGNIILGASGGQIHYNADHDFGMANHNGTLYFYCNSLYKAIQVFDTGSGGGGDYNSFLNQKVDARNNILWPLDPTNFTPISFAETILDATTNLFRQGSVSITTPLMGTTYGYFGTSESDGWPAYCHQQAPCPWPLTVPLEKHLYGLNSANYLFTASTPFNTTNFVPVKNSAAIGKGSALSGVLATMPVRWQYSTLTHSLLPRTQPLTIGAEDYQPVTATPSFTPVAGQYNTAQDVTISSTTASAIIYYTTNGTTPSASSTKYSAPVHVGVSETLKAIAIAPGNLPSVVASAAYSIGPPAATPTFLPAAGTYTTIQSVTIASTTPSAKIRYTLDGSNPNTSSTAKDYSGPVAVAQTETLQAVARATGYSPSAVGSAAYTINLPTAATPKFSLSAGVYSTAQSVTITDSTSGAKIHYTTDGSDPSASSKLYSAAVQVTVTEQIKAIAVATGYKNSSIASSVYVIGTPVASQFVLTTPAKTLAGSAMSFSLTAEDQYGYVATGYGGTVHFTSSDSAAVLPADTHLTNGTGTVTATLKTVGLQTITALDKASNAISGVSAGVQVTLSPNLVITTAADDAGVAAQCTPQNSPYSGTDAACSLRDALLYAANTTGESITFDSKVFAPSKTAAQRTVTVTHGSLTVPEQTKIYGPTSVTNGVALPRVTVSGGGASGSLPVFTVNGTGSIIENLVITAQAGATDNTALSLGYGAQVQLRNISLSGSKPPGSSTLGGIFVNYTSSLTMSKSSIANFPGTAIAMELGSSLSMSASTISGNQNGGIWNDGTVVASASTIAGNSFSNSGGGILSSGKVTLTDCTVTGNTSGYLGGGISNTGTLKLTRTIVAGNHAAAQYADLNGPYTDGGGNVVGTGAGTVSTISIRLAPLNSYGGPTQTMPPLPGSPALCAITPTQTSGTDQRGLPRTTTYGSTLCQDTGAAQTNYALTFTTQPPNGKVGHALSPAPVVTLIESAVPASTATGSVTLTDSAGLLPASTSATFASGKATFSNLVFGKTVSSDQLTATLPLSSKVKIAAQSTAFSITQ